MGREPQKADGPPQPFTAAEEAEKKNEARHFPRLPLLLVSILKDDETHPLERRDDQLVRDVDVDEDAGLWRGWMDAGERR